MTRNSHAAIHSERGLTVVELIIVLMLIGILAAIALPNFMQWRQRLEYREAARSVASVLRQARSQAIATNLEQQVVFTQLQRQYGIQSAVNQAYNAIAWNPNLSNVATLPNAVAAIPDTSIQFFPNGTATLPGAVATYNVPVNDLANVVRFQVVVTTAGRISIIP